MAPKKRASLGGHTQDPVWWWVATKKDSSWRLPRHTLPRGLFPGQLLTSCIPLRSCELSTDQRRKQPGEPYHDEPSSSDVSSCLPVTPERMTRKVHSIGRGKTAKAHR